MYKHTSVVLSKQSMQLNIDAEEHRLAAPPAVPGICFIFFFFFTQYPPPSNFLKIKIKNHTQSQGSATWLALSPLPHSWREPIFTVAMAALILSHIWSFLSTLLHDSVHRLPLSMAWASGGETIASARTGLLARSSQPSVHPQAVLGLLRFSYVVFGQLFWMYRTQFVRFFIFFSHLFTASGDWHIKSDWNQLCFQMAHKVHVSGNCLLTC